MQPVRAQLARFPLRARVCTHCGLCSTLCATLTHTSPPRAPPSPSLGLARAQATQPEEKTEAHVLPKANIDRMVNASLPLAYKTSMESKVILQYLASEFLAFIASEADSVSKVRALSAPRRGRKLGCDAASASAHLDACAARPAACAHRLAQTDRRRAISGEDVLKAFRNLGLERYADSLEMFGKRAKLKRAQPGFAMGTSVFDDILSGPAKKPKATSCSVSAVTSDAPAALLAYDALARGDGVQTDHASASRGASSADPQIRIERALAELEAICASESVIVAGEILLHELVTELDDGFFQRFDEETHERCGGEHPVSETAS